MNRRLAVARSRSRSAASVLVALVLVTPLARAGEPSGVSPMLRAAATEVGRASGSPRAASTMIHTVGPGGLVRADGAGRLHAFVYVDGWSESARTALTLAGAEIDLANERLRVLQAWLPATRLDAIARLPFVRRVTPPSYAEPQAGRTQTEGDAIHRADVLRAMGVTGRGVRVGVISDGALDFQDSRDAGELPDDVSILSPGQGYEGTALMEIVHDLAPDAKLGFCSGRPSTPQTLLEFVDCADRLADDFGASVIVDDVNFLGTPWFEDGADAIAVNDAIAKGVVWVSAAANFGDSHYQGHFTDAGDPLHSHDFGGGDVTMPVHVPVGGMTVFLQWGNPFESVADDYAVCLVSHAEGVADTCSTRFDPANPLEAVTLPCANAVACDVDIAIRRESGATRDVELYFTQRVSYGPQRYGTARDSIFGHAAAREAISVAAINATDPGTDDVTSYSGEGPVSIFFPEPEIRAKPDVSGIDCVSVSTAGQFQSPFCGTSAAAPHVAGIVALLRSAFATASVADIRDAMLDGAVDVGAPGFEDRGGAGRVDAERSATLLAERVGSSPIATIVEPSADTTIRAGQTVTFSGSCADPISPGGLGGHWTFGDASGVSPRDELSPGAVTFPSAGTHRVSFTCTNAAGRPDPTPDTRTITVRSASGGGGGGCEVAGGEPAGSLAIAAALLLATRARRRRAGLGC